MSVLTVPRSIATPVRNRMTPALCPQCRPPSPVWSLRTAPVGRRTDRIPPLHGRWHRREGQRPPPQLTTPGTAREADAIEGPARVNAGRFGDSRVARSWPRARLGGPRCAAKDRNGIRDVRHAGALIGAWSNADFHAAGSAQGSGEFVAEGPAA